MRKSRTLKLKAAKWNSALIIVIIYDISSPFKSVQWVKHADFDLSSNYKVDSAQSINYGRAVVFECTNKLCFSCLCQCLSGDILMILNKSRISYNL